MALFVIADLHLSFSVDKPMDIFSGWDNYIEKVEKMLKLIVKESDKVVIAGDFSWSMMLEDTYKDFKFFHWLQGKKIILKGNHDYWWVTMRKMNDYLEKNNFDTISFLFNNSYIVDDYAICGTRGWYYDAQSKEDVKVLNREVGRLKLSIEKALESKKEPIVFLHYPPVYSDLPCQEILDVLHDYNIKKCYYGHIHGGNAAKKAHNGLYEGINMKLIACDYINFTPMLVR